MLMIPNFRKLLVLTSAIALFVAVGANAQAERNLAADLDGQMLAMEDIPVDLDADAPEADAPAAVEAPDAPAAPAAEKGEIEALVNDAFSESSSEVGELPAKAVESTPIVMDPAVADKVRVIEAQEALIRMARDVYGKNSLAEADSRLGRGDHEKARELYQAAYDNIVMTDTENRELALQGIAESYYRHGYALYKQGDMEDAVKQARAAIKAGHPKGAKLLDRIESTPPKKDIVRIPDSLLETKEYIQEKERTRKRLIRAQQYYNAREFDLCRYEISQILFQFPSNVEAKSLQLKLENRVYDDESMKFEAGRRKMIADVRASWITTPVEFAVDVEEMAGAKLRQRGETLEDRIVKKMREIILPDVKFEGANPRDVIKWIQEQSREHDEERDETKRGVSFALDTLPEEIEGGDATGGVFDAPAGASNLRRIVVSASYISLYDTLETVCDMANLKWYLQGKVVVIVDKDKPIKELVSKDYNVMPTLSDLVSSTAGARGGDGGNSPFGAIEGNDADGGSDWQLFFESFNVAWPSGSSISYMAPIGKLFVTNTRNNLDKLEYALSQMNVTPRQIEIEARFVEVLQTDLESLGFEWLVNDDVELASKNDPSRPPWAQERISMEATDLTTGNRLLRDGAGIAEAVPMADNVLTITSFLTNPELSFVLHMLDQKGNTDLLSAPKVTTRANYDAEIKMVTEYIYPTEFEVTGLESTSGVNQNNNNTVGAVVEPQNFETREVGVILKVTPEVSPEGHMINLQLSPEVVTPPEWKNYGSTYVDSNGNTQQLNMEQPFFNTRTVNTSLSIYNGATVVMGGMITELRVEIDDKVPFLGDIPLLGRLFRSNYEKSEKRNLLIFVTARLVGPDGKNVGVSGDTTRRVRAALTPREVTDKPEEVESI